MTRRIFKVPFVAFSLVASLVLVGTPAFSASIAGTKCTKVGTTKTASNILYTCIKQGSKLVWNKGVAIKPATKATPAPTFVPPKAPTSFDDLVANYAGIAYSAWKKAHDKIEASPDTPINLEILIGKSAALNYKTPEVAYSLVNRLYYSAPLPSKVVHMVFNYEDRDWAMAKMEELVPNAVSAWIKDVACPTKATCYGGGSYYNPNTKVSLVVLGTTIDSNNVENSISGTVEAHEYAHLIEQTWPNMYRPPVNLLQSPWPPNWYWEGVAQFSQHASVYTSSFDNYIKYRKASTDDLFKNPTWNADYIQGYFQRTLTTEWGIKYPRWRQYDLGAMLVEVLVALKGPDLAMKMFDSSLHGGGFDNAFQSIYGVSFESVLPNISKAIALELGNA